MVCGSVLSNLVEMNRYVHKFLMNFETLLHKPLYLFAFLMRLLDKYFPITRINLIFFFVFRFLHNVRNLQNKYFVPGSAPELYRALLQLVTLEQNGSFHSKMSLIQEGKILPKNYCKLSHFLDNIDILRVGDRLANAPIPVDTKFSALLPSNSRCTIMYAGIQTVQFLLTQRFYILNVKKCMR